MCSYYNYIMNNYSKENFKTCANLFYLFDFSKGCDSKTLLNWNVSSKSWKTLLCMKNNNNKRENWWLIDPIIVLMVHEMKLYYNCTKLKNQVFLANFRIINKMVLCIRNKNMITFDPRMMACIRKSIIARSLSSSVHYTNMLLVVISCCG